MATVLALPALTVYLGFNQGGYFAGSTAWAAIALAVALALRLAVRGVSLPPRPVALAAGALALLALWALLSANWSDSTGRALIEFDRALLYLLALLVFGSIESPRKALRWLPVGFAVAAVVLCGAGFVTQALPDQWPFDLPPKAERLAFPITYPNGLGLLAALGMVACLHGAAWERGHTALRVASVAALPLLGATLALTFSRGAVAAAAVGAIVYLIASRPRGLLAASIAAVPATAVAVQQALAAELLASNERVTAASLDQGQDLALVVLAAMAAAAVVLGLLIPIERRLFDWRRYRRALPQHAVPAMLAVAAAITMVVAAQWLPDAIDSVRNEIDRGSPTEGAPTRDRLTNFDIGGQNRLDYWQVSLDTFSSEPLRGTGVGTFGIAWARDRPFPESVTEGHSLYLETLAELGLVGGVLLVVVLVTMLVPFFYSRTGERPLRGTVLALAAIWLVHAALDWDWEVPALTLWLFAVGGTGLAAWSRRSERARAAGVTGRPAWQRWAPRATGVVVCLLLALTPLAIARSQSKLDAAYAAFERGDCDATLTLAAEASEILPPRHEPYEARAYCFSRLGLGTEAIQSMEAALERSPDNWELVYGLALIRATAGEDPTRQLARVHSLNPLEPSVVAAREVIQGSDPDRWPQQAAGLNTPFP